MKKLLAVILLSCLPVAGQAESWYFGLSPGGAIVDHDDYEGSTVVSIFGEYQFLPYVGVETASVLFDQFATKSNDDIYLHGYGQSLGVAGHIPIRRVTLDGGAGLFVWQMQSRAYQETIGEDEGVSPYFKVGLNVMLPAHITIGGATTWYGDVSGADILTFALKFGLRF